MSIELPSAPYDSDQLTKLANKMYGGTTSSGTPPVSVSERPEPDLVNDPTFSHYPGKLSRLVDHSVDLIHVVTPDGRLERASQRSEKLQKRIEVAAYLGRRILHPEVTGTLAENISNIGTNKLDARESVDPKTGNLIISRNSNRPVTKSERAVDKRLDKLASKNRDVRREARWLKESWKGNFGAIYDPRSGYRLGKDEQKNMRGASKGIKSSLKKSGKYLDKIDKIADSRDLSGKITKWRLERAKSFPERQNRRFERTAMTMVRGGHLVSEGTKAVARGSYIVDQAAGEAIVRGSEVAVRSTKIVARNGGVVAKRTGGAIVKGSKVVVKTVRKPFKKSVIEDVESSTDEQSL